MSRFRNSVSSILFLPRYSLSISSSNSLGISRKSIRNVLCPEVGREFSSKISVGVLLPKRCELGRKFLGSGRKEVLISHKRCMSSVPTQFLDLGNSRKIAYKLTVGDNTKPTVVYVPGLLNVMEETKAATLNEFCESSKLTLVRFDFEGIGESPGNIKKVMFGQWIENVRHVVNQLCKTPVIYVAFSMGGWLSTKMAIEMPEKLHSILYVAPGFNFIKYYYDIFYEKLPPEQKKALDDGKCVYFNDLFLRKDFAIESVKHHINLKEKIPITAPIRILHGMLDRDAPFKVSVDLLPQFESTDVDLYLRKSGKHYMTEPSDLALMTSLLGDLVQNYPLSK